MENLASNAALGSLSDHNSSSSADSISSGLFNNVESLLKNASRLVKSRKFQEAIQNYTAILGEEPMASPEVQFSCLVNRSHCFTSLGEVNGGISDAERALSLFPNHEKVSNDLIQHFSHPMVLFLFI